MFLKRITIKLLEYISLIANSYLRMYGEFQCLDADAIREEVENMHRVSIKN